VQKLSNKRQEYVDFAIIVFAFNLRPKVDYKNSY
jgi:hypothetical protein